MSTPVTGIMRCRHNTSGEVFDIYLPMAVQQLGKITRGLDDGWVAEMLPPDAERVTTLELQDSELRYIPPEVVGKPASEIPGAG
jgi:hypothetical protein